MGPSKRRFAMFGSVIIEVAIGLVFVYLLLSLICSAVNEMIEAKLKNRATDLEKGIRELLSEKDGKGIMEKMYAHPLICGLFEGVYKPKDRVTPGDYMRKTTLPSYIPSRNFALALMDTVMDPSGKGSLPHSTVNELRTAIGGIENPAVKRALNSFISHAGDDVDAVRQSIEAWFDSGMERVAGWYKRRTQWILLGLGLAVSIILNVNTLTVAEHLWTDPALRAVVTEQAKTYGQGENKFESIKNQINSLGLPIGWSKEDPGMNAVSAWASPASVVYGILRIILGWLLTAGAISFGAPFWFDLLNKFLLIRSTVKPDEKKEKKRSGDPLGSTGSIPGWLFHSV
jgi:hypothetical protein